MSLIYRSSLDSGGIDEGIYGITINGNVTPPAEVIAPSIKETLNYNWEEIELFNDPVIIGEKVTDCNNLFQECESFNQPVNLPNNLINAAGMFECCYTFDQPINLPSTLYNMSGMFYYCYEFNQPLNFSNLNSNFVNMNGMFYYSNFNCPLDFSNLSNIIEIDMSSILNNCENFNQPVIFPELIEQEIYPGYNIYTGLCNIAGAFYGCYSFNQPVNLPNHVSGPCVDTFAYSAFNFPITLPKIEGGRGGKEVRVDEKVYSYQDMFFDCAFNQPIIIQDNTTSLGFLFRGSYYNQPLTIPYEAPDEMPIYENMNTVKRVDCSGMFEESQFNQPIHNINNIGCGIFRRMFCNDRNYDLPTIIPHSYYEYYPEFMNESDSRFSYLRNSSPEYNEDCSNMFLDALNFNNEVTFLGNSYWNCSYMFACSDSLSLVSQNMKFNHSVNLPNYIHNCYSMFANAPLSDAIITMPHYADDCSRMFYGDKYYNPSIDYITVPIGTVNCSEMFYGVPYNGDVWIKAYPEATNNTKVNFYHMFGNHDNYYLPSNIYIDLYGDERTDTEYKPKDFYQMFYLNERKRADNSSYICTNIYAYDDIVDILINCNNLFDGTYEGRPDLFWNALPDGNGYYSRALNIYLYNNYDMWEPGEEPYSYNYPYAYILGEEIPGEGPIVINP